MVEVTGDTMASMAHYLTLPSVGASPVVMLQGGAKSKRWSTTKAVSMRRKNVEVKSASLSISPMRSPFQSLIGMRKPSAIDSLTAKVGKDFKSLVEKSTERSKQSGASRAGTTAAFEAYSEKAIKVIILAQEEARRLRYNFVGTEQILLGLVGEGTGISATVLKGVKVNLREARVEVEKLIGYGSGFVPVEVPSALDRRWAWRDSLEEAKKLGQKSVCAQRMLLAQLREGEGVAARVLEKLGANPSNIRALVMRHISESQTKQAKKMIELGKGIGIRELIRVMAHLLKLKLGEVDVDEKESQKHYIYIISRWPEFKSIC